METHDHIVARIPVARNRGAEESRVGEVEVINAWLWPSADGQEARALEQPAVVEVSLLPETRKLLRDFPAPGLERPYLRHLEQRIHRNPRDLLSHVRRFYIASELRDPEAIEGALADLFIVLGRRGQALRTRLLELVADQLNPELRSFFEASLEKGLHANRAMPDMPQSRLSKRVIGTTQVVTRSGNDNLASEEPVALARESLASGRYEVARAVLEGALESDPGDKEVSTELLELYRRNNLQESFFSTYTILLGRKLAYPERWAELADDFRSRK